MPTLSHELGPSGVLRSAGMNTSGIQFLVGARPWSDLVWAQPSATSGWCTSCNKRERERAGFMLLP